VPAPDGVVVATRDRRTRLATTLDRLAALPEDPPVVVVDNGSRDGTASAVQATHPGVRVVALDRNAGGAARTVGARALATPLVAFADDDSWWAPGALERACALFAAHPRLGLLAARVLVGPEGRLDPVCAAMAASPLPAASDLPGPRVLGFVACGAVVRRDAFLAAGGFHRRFGVGGEEELLALDLAVLGWGLAYVPAVVAQHHPESGPRAGRPEVQARNALRTAWLRRPAGVVLRRTLAAHRSWARPRPLIRAARDLPWVLRERRVLPAAVEQDLRRLEATG